MSRETLLRKHIPPQRTLITFRTTPSGTNVRAQFKVPIPDSRLRVKITLLFVPAAGAAPSISGTLWLYEAEMEDAGVAGAVMGTTNVEGTSASPTTIPAASTLQGYSREFVSAGDYIIGQLNSGPPSAGPGSWVLQTRYQPDAVRFTDEEWDRIKAQCYPDLIVGPVMDGT